jgi:hypothetical protein
MLQTATSLHVVNTVGRSSGDLEVVSDVMEKNSEEDDDAGGGDVVQIYLDEWPEAVDHEKVELLPNIGCHEKLWTY